MQKTALKDEPQYLRPWHRLVFPFYKRKETNKKQTLVSIMTSRFDRQDRRLLTWAVLLKHITPTFRPVVEHVLGDVSGRVIRSGADVK